jgi:hypothetical protein
MGGICLTGDNGGSGGLKEYFPLFLPVRDNLLTDAKETAQLKFLKRAPFVNGFNQSRTDMAMHFNCGSDDDFGQMQCFAEQRMDGGGSLFNRR